MNKQILLASRPTGFPEEANFQLVETPLPQPDDGEGQADDGPQTTDER